MNGHINPKNSIYERSTTLETMAKCSRSTCDRYVIQSGTSRMSQPYFDNHCSLYCWKINSVPSLINFMETWIVENPNKPNPPIEHNCECCGDSYTLNYPWNWSNQIFCSKKCQFTTYRGKRIKHTIKILQFLKTKQLIDSQDYNKSGDLYPTGFTAKDIAYLLNSVHPNLMLTPGGVVQRLLPLIAKSYVCKIPKTSDRESTRYYFNPLYQSEPLRSLIHRKV